MSKGNYFPKVREARQKLAEKAQEILEEYLLNIQAAKLKGDHETALKGLQWLIEHMPDEEGESMVNSSIDKAKEKQIGGGGPTIQIGFQLGGITTPPKALPDPEVIDVKPTEDPDQSNVSESEP